MAISSTRVFSASNVYQYCYLYSTCTIGEFLYNDDYTPNTTSSCTLTARDPSGNIYLNTVSMTGQSDGWYQYSFDPSGANSGVYRAQLCCTAGPDYLCLDKTFEVGDEQVSNLSEEQVASAVLNANPSEYNNPNTIGQNLQNPTLTASDIWSFSTRSLTTFGTLISDIWKHDPTDAQQTDNSAFNALQSQISENRSALEKLLNEPIIKTFLEEGQSPDLKAKINTTRELTNTLYAETQSLKSRLTILSSKWKLLPEREIESELKLIIESLGKDTGKPTEGSLVFAANWLEEAWGNPVTSQVANTSQTTLTNLISLSRDLDYYGKSSTSTNSLTSAISALSDLEEYIGDVSNSASAPTLFGHLRKVQQRAQLLEEQESKLQAILEQIDNTSQNDLTSSINQAEKEVLALNEFQSALRILTSKFGTVKQQLRNRIYGLDAIVDINRSLLAHKAGQPVEGIWLEEGSIVFRSIITNPSKLVSQTVTLKYILPEELKEEDIIDIDPALSVNFDLNENSLVVEGEFEVGPDEAVIVFLETEDIWQISDEEIDSYKSQSEEMLQALEDTSFFGQATTLKSDIFVSLDKILGSQSETKSPSSRIRTYRENKLELLGVIEKIEVMKGLVAQADSVSSLKGFIGGSQAIGVWSLVIIFIGGFAFMTYHMKSVNPAFLGIRRRSAMTRSISITRPSFSFKRLLGLEKPRIISLDGPSRPAYLPIAIIIILTASISTILLTVFISRNRNEEVLVLAPIEEVPSSPTPSPDNRTILGQTPTELQMVLNLEDFNSIDVHAEPDIDSDVVMSLRSSRTVYVFANRLDESGSLWMKIGFAPEDKDNEWWIESRYLSDLPLE